MSLGDGGGMSGNIDTLGHAAGIGVFWNWIWELVFGKVKNGEFFRRMGIFGIVEDEGRFLEYLIGKELLYYCVIIIMFIFISFNFTKKESTSLISLFKLTKYIFLFLFDFCINYMISMLYSPSGKWVSYSAASTRKRSRKFRPYSYNDVNIHSHACLHVVFFILSHLPTSFNSSKKS